jgi:hypothetical protein
MTRKYTVIKNGNGKYLAVMILSEHDTEDDALTAMLSAMNKESKAETHKEIKKLHKQGINAVTVEEATKDMTPEELERFLEERQRKFINPLLDANIKDLETKDRRMRIKRIK